MQVLTKARQRPGITSLFVIVAVILVGLGVYWFGPQKLLLSETANDVLPGQGGGAGSTVAEGSFVSLAHQTTGAARIVEADGETFLRFEDLDSLNGPDLVVYLTAQAATADASGFDDTVVVDLGELEANRGDLNIEIPAGTDLSDVKSVVIWCRRFTVAFGAADLAPTA